MMFVITELEAQFICDTLKGIEDYDTGLESEIEECLTILEDMQPMPLEEYLKDE